MPTIWYEQGFRFSFFPADRREPPHVHVQGSSGIGKWWLAPITEARSRGLTASEKSKIERIIRARHGDLLGRWNDYFSQN